MVVANDIIAADCTLPTRYLVLAARSTLSRLEISASDRMLAGARLFFCQAHAWPICLPGWGYGRSELTVNLPITNDSDKGEFKFTCLACQKALVIYFPGTIVNDNFHSVDIIN